ncbi:thiaminase II [Dyadobacter sandarakinus]|uniref:Aminopyrimidine aminohydrolase n=1 Tax=Dyadobacter sandarakinus TaxID=2747268 RepID=A0ABX7I705_9BACT|nr:thiaminase II [Dyadobacter sandarakinus]QRR01891.1 thiaminase II [Dyadobacter sandarakinus]
MSFTTYLWEEALPIYRQISQHPFNQELKTGTLPVEKFKFYIAQDSLYLADFARALAAAGSRAGNSHDALDFFQFAQNAILVERALHLSYFKNYEIDNAGTKGPGCFAYTSYLLSVSAFESFEVAVAALLPCFWIYKKVGDDMYASQSSGNPYQSWIDAYGGEEFGHSVRKALDICDRLAEQASAGTCTKMREAYLTASRLEYIFWDDAYHLRTWPC